MSNITFDKAAYISDTSAAAPPSVIHEIGDAKRPRLWSRAPADYQVDHLVSKIAGSYLGITHENYSFKVTRKEIKVTVHNPAPGAAPDERVLKLDASGTWTVTGSSTVAPTTPAQSHEVATDAATIIERVRALWLLADPAPGVPAAPTPAVAAAPAPVAVPPPSINVGAPVVSPVINVPSPTVTVLPAPTPVASHTAPATNIHINVQQTPPSAAPVDAAVLSALNNLDNSVSGLGERVRRHDESLARVNERVRRAERNRRRARHRRDTSSSSSRSSSSSPSPTSSSSSSDSKRPSSGPSPIPPVAAANPSSIPSGPSSVTPSAASSSARPVRRHPTVVIRPGITTTQSGVGGTVTHFKNVGGK